MSRCISCWNYGYSSGSCVSWSESVPDFEGHWHQSLKRGGHLHREGRTENSWKFNKFSATHRQFSSRGLKVFVFDLVNCGRHICCFQILSFSVFQIFLFGKAIFRIDHVARLTKKRRTVPCWWNYPPAKGSTWNGSISRLFVLFVFALHGSVRISVNEPPFNFLEAQGL